MKFKTPVAVIGFVRSDVLRATLNNLSQAYGVLDRVIYVYLSAPRNPQEAEKTSAVKHLVEEFKSNHLPNIVIVERDQNNGAGKNIRQAVTDTVDIWGRAIIIEDDVLVSRTFLNYMDSALDLYENDNRVWCINGYKNPYMNVPRSYKHDIYLTKRNMAWGWGTWRDRWQQVDFGLEDWMRFKTKAANLAKLLMAGEDIPDMLTSACNGILDTWDVQCVYHIAKHDLYAVEPRYSLTKNIGFGVADSVHFSFGKEDPVLRRQKYFDFTPRLIPEIMPDLVLLNKLRYSAYDYRLLYRLARRFKRIVKSFSPLNDVPCTVIC